MQVTQSQETQKYKREPSEGQQFSLLQTSLIPQFQNTQRTTLSNLDETEQEAIELIQSQVTQIRALQDQIRNKDEVIEGLKCQGKQVDAYKSQIQNLKHQISLFEERFKYYDEDRLMQERKFMDQSRSEEWRVKALAQEVEDLQFALKRAKKQVEEEVLKQKQMQMTIEQKEQLYLHIKEQVENLSRQMEGLQHNMVEREDQLQQKIAQMKKEGKQGAKEKKAMEQRLKEIQEQLQSKHQDSLNQSKFVQDKDLIIVKSQFSSSMQKKLKDDVQKLKRERDDFKRQKEQLDSRMPSLEQQLLELNKVVERCASDIEKEQAKREQLCRENSQLREKVAQFQHLYQDLEISDPQQFREELEQTKVEISELREELDRKSQSLKQKEERLGQWEGAQKEWRAQMNEMVSQKVAWVNENLVPSRVFGEGEQEEEEDGNQSTNMETDTFDRVDQQTLKVFFKLQQALMSRKQQLRQKFKKVEEKHQNLQSELQQANRLKQEIIDDFKKLKSSVQQSDENFAAVMEENQALQGDAQRLKEMLQEEKELQYAKEQADMKSQIEVYNALYNLRHNFENCQRVAKEVDMSLKCQFANDRWGSIIELSNIVSEITNILNFEVKSIEIKDQQFQQLSSAYQELQSHSSSEVSRLEQERKDELTALHGSFEKKYRRFKECQEELERVNMELQGENNELKHQLQERGRLGEQVRAELAKIKMRNDEVCRELECYNANMPGMVRKVEELVWQKEVLKRQLKNLQGHFQNCQKATQFLAKKCKGEGQNRNSKESLATGKNGKSKKQNNRYKGQSSMKEEGSTPSLHFASNCMKFRKYVIAVLGCLRFRRLYHSRPAQEFDFSSPSSSEKVFDPQNIARHFRYAPTPRILKNAVQANLQEQKSHYSELSFPDLPSLLQQGMRSLKYLVQDSQQEMTSAPVSEQYLFYVFRPDDFFTRHLFLLEKEVAAQSAQQKWLEASLGEFQQENKLLNDKLAGSREEVERLGVLCGSQAEQLRQLQEELSESVSKQEFARIEGNYDEISRQFYGVKEQLNRLQEKLDKLAKEKEELEAERKKLFQNIVNLESSAADKEREAELKDVKIESLQNVLAKREAQMETSANVFRLEQRIRELEQDKEKLVRDNIVLIRDNEHLKEQIQYTLREEQDRYLQSQGEKEDRHREIQKLMEQNVRTMEDRCSLLEGQIHQLKRDKDELIGKNRKLLGLDSDEKENDNSNVGRGKEWGHFDKGFEFTGGSMRSPTFQNLNVDNSLNSTQQLNDSASKIPGKIAKRKL